jgi:hypothetical protein
MLSDRYKEVAVLRLLARRGFINVHFDFPRLECRQGLRLALTRHKVVGNQHAQRGDASIPRCNVLV